MIRLACNIPHKVVIAYSAGPDSSALLSFAIAGRKNVIPLFVDHGTEFSKVSLDIAKKYCQDNNLELIVRHAKPESRTELEWRNDRLEIYKEFTGKGLFVATGATLDDAMEWYLLSALHGNPKLMAPVDVEHKLIKPFLFAEKVELLSWCHRKNIQYAIDPTNIGEYNSRALLRSEAIPALLKIHPGFKSTIKNKLLETLEN